MKKIISKIIISSILLILVIPIIFIYKTKITFATGESWSYDFTMAGEIKHVKNPFGFDSLEKCEAARKDFVDNTVSKKPDLYVSITQCESVTVYYYEYGLKLTDGTYSTSPSQNFTTPEECEIARKKIIDNPNYNPNTSKISPACIQKGEAIVYIDGQKPVEVNKDVYNFLAPIAGLKCMNTNGTDGCVKSDIGTYLNIIFKLGIGIAAALAVIMLIINGITYMGDESIFSKTEAKKKMFSAVLGLFIALGAWALLNTINPDLTGKNGIVIDGIQIETEPLYDRGASDPKNANGESVRCTPVTSGPCSIANLTKYFPDDAIAMSKICNMESSGVENISSGTDVCKPGNEAFSFGLFQVNLAANGILAGEDCVDLFDKKVAGKDAIAPKYTSGYSCKLLSGKENIYETCKNRLLNTTTNLEIAKKLYTPSKNAWLGDKKYCASAFN